MNAALRLFISCFKTHAFKQGVHRRPVPGFARQYALQFPFKLFRFAHVKVFEAAMAQLIPSIAAEIMPPAYPAPSPQGNKPATCGSCSGSLSRGMLTGDEVRDSTPTNIASLVYYPFILRPNAGSALRSRSLIQYGNISFSGALFVPGKYELTGKEPDTRPSTKSTMRCAGATSRPPPAL